MSTPTQTVPGGLLPQPRRIIGWLSRSQWIVAPLAVVCLVLLPAIGLDDYWQRQLILISVYTLLASSVNLSFGFAGELALGQVTTFALGSYVTALLFNHGWTDLLAAAAVSAVAAAVLGLVIGVCGLKLNNWSLAVTSFFLVLLIPVVVVILPSQTGGLQGEVGIIGPTIFSYPLSEVGFYGASIVLAALWLFCFRNIILSRIGLALANMRESPLLVASLGMSDYRLKLKAYVIGSIPAGIAGAIMAYLVGLVQPDSYTVDVVTAILAASIIGGSSSIWGAPIGAAIVVLGPVQATSLQNYSLIAYGAFIVLVAAAFPLGFAGFLARIISRARSWVRPSISMVDSGSKSKSNVPALPLVMPGEKVTITALSKRFAGVAALDGVDMTIQPGVVTAIMGANGAGKTTLLNAISGYLEPDQGKIELGGREVSGLRPAKVARSGVGRTFQTPVIPDFMSTLDVVRSGRLGKDEPSLLATVFRTRRFRRTRDADERAALETLAFAGLLDLAVVEARALPLGTRRLLEVVRALASRPNVLLLDEPAAGLDGEALEDLRSLVVRARDAGATVVLVEHNVPFIMGVADDVHVMDLGKVIASGTPAEVRTNPMVIERYLGRRRTDEPAQVRQRAERVAEVDVQGAALLEVDGLRVGYGDLTVIRGASLSLREGELTALLGRNGAGKTTLLMGISGVLRSGSGRVSLRGIDITKHSAADRVDMGLGLVQEGKRVFRRLSVQENLVLGLAKGHRSGVGRREALESIYSDFPVLADRRDERAGQLSGGQQQMLAIATALIAQPAVLLVDEPSSGLAPVFVEEVLNILETLRGRGLAILLVEQLVEKVLGGLADKVIVLDRGEVVMSADPAEVSEEALTKFLYTA